MPKKRLQTIQPKPVRHQSRREVIPFWNLQNDERSEEEVRNTAVQYNNISVEPEPSLVAAAALKNGNGEVVKVGRLVNKHREMHSLKNVLESLGKLQGKAVLKRGLTAKDLSKSPS